MRKNHVLITLAAVLLAVSLCAPLFLFPAYADEENGFAVPKTVSQDPAVQKKAADTVFDDFSKASVSWKSDNEIMTVTSPAFEGSRSLRFVSNAKLSVGKNANKTRFVLITVLSENDVPLTFSTEGNVVYSKTVTVGGGQWQTLVFDLYDEANIIPHA
ncbi:MAG: hypothetical protein MJ078_08425, partial [Clostridia bacterium]|nr:hypothetical protein [Clostridia bacterium]